MKISRLFILFLPTIILAQWVAAREPGQLSLKPNLSFIANVGQITDQHYNTRKDIDFKLNAAGMDIFIGDGQIHYQWSKSLSSAAAAKTKLKKNRLEESNVDIYRMDVELVGANKNARVVAEEPQAFYERYYTMETGDEGLVAHSYQKITYQDIYPNIDWVLYTKDKQLKYDFVVRPGGNVANIQLKYAGATSLQLEDGALTATTPFGSIAEQKPYSYEATTGKEITSRYVLQDGVLSFKAGTCNSTLIIDPTLQWGTYYGGAQADGAYDITTDLTGHIYMCGGGSSNNIATAGTFLSVLPTGGAYVAKFNSTGQRLWGTYYYGSFLSVACDYNGMVYVGGSTNGTFTNVATPGSHQPIYGGGNSDGLLVKFDGNGQRVWGTYYGGNSGSIYGETITSIVCDPYNNIYISGLTDNATGMTTPGCHQPGFGGGSYDHFLAKFNTGGQRQWGTFYGGPFDEFIDISVATDYWGNVYLGGTTASYTGIATAGSYKQIYGGGAWDAYIAKFNTNGQRLWSTYYGGAGGEQYSHVAVDGTGSVYLFGYTNSPTDIATSGAYQPFFVGTGIYNAYITKFTTTGQRLWGTYYGDTANVIPIDMTFDIARNIYIIGITPNTASGISTPGSHQPLYGGGASDCFLAKFNSSGQRLWGSFFGGAGNEIFTSYTGGIAADTTGSIYIAGSTTSTNAISTAASHQPGYGGGASDGFLAKFRNEDTLVYIKALLTDTLLCPLDTIRVPYGLTYNFRSNNTFTLQLSDASGSFISPTTIGTVATNAAGWINGVIPVTAAAGTDYRVRIVASAPADTSLWRSIHIKPRPAAPSTGSNTPVCSGQAINLNALTGAAGASYHWTGPASYSSNVQSPTRANATTAMGGVYNVTVTVDGCTSAATPTTVVVNPSPAAPVAGSNSPICAGTSLNLTASLVPGVSYSWNGPGAFTSNQQNPVINPAGNAAGNYTVNVTDGNGCVSANATTTVVINNSNAPTVGVFPNPNDSVCPGAMVTFIAVPNNGGTPAYQWYKNSLQIPGATNATYMTNTVSTGDFYSVAMTSTAVCAVPATVNSNNVIMTVVPPVVPSVTISASPGLNVGPWRMITFTATPVNGGSSPTYQWLRNGQPVIGAVSNTWGANNLSDNDVISVVLFSSEVCAIPPTDTSNKQLVHINLGILDHSNNTANIQLYPNPNNGDFVIKGDLSEAVSIEVVNAIGQTVYSSQLTVGSQQSFAYPIHLDVASGGYLLKVASDKGVEMVRFRVE